MHDEAASGRVGDSGVEVDVRAREVGLDQAVGVQLAPRRSAPANRVPWRRAPVKSEAPEVRLR